MSVGNSKRRGIQVGEREQNESTLNVAYYFIGQRGGAILKVPKNGIWAGLGVCCPGKINLFH